MLSQQQQQHSSLPLHHEPTACQDLPFAPSGRMEPLPIGSTGSEGIQLGSNREGFRTTWRCSPFLRTLPTSRTGMSNEHAGHTKHSGLACENQYISTGQLRTQVGLACKKTDNKPFLPSLSVYMMEDFTPAAIAVHESKSIFPTKAEVTRERQQEQVKQAQREKNERKPCWHIVRIACQIFITSSLPSPALLQLQ